MNCEVTSSPSQADDDNEDDLLSPRSIWSTAQGLTETTCSSERSILPCPPLPSPAPPLRYQASGFKVNVLEKEDAAAEGLGDWSKAESSCERDGNVEEGGVGASGRRQPASRSLKRSLWDKTKQIRRGQGNVPPFFRLIPSRFVQNRNPEVGIAVSPGSVSLSGQPTPGSKPSS